MEFYELSFLIKEATPNNHYMVVEAIQNGQLKIVKGDGFKLKSGRMSPYFFNSGLYTSGQELADLADLYAHVLYHHYKEDLEDAVLFGPPYKGIALANITAAALSIGHGRNVEVASSRKEAKDHGEGGILMGADMSNRKVVIIDDVITDGASKREAMDLIRGASGIPIGGIIAFDRQERGKDTDLSGAQQFEKEFGVPMLSIATFADLIKVFQTYPDEETGEPYTEITDRLLAYRAEYGAVI